MKNLKAFSTGTPFISEQQVHVWVSSFKTFFSSKSFYFRKISSCEGLSMTFLSRHELILRQEDGRYSSHKADVEYNEIENIRVQN